MPATRCQASIEALDNPASVAEKDVSGLALAESLQVGVSGVSRSTGVFDARVLSWCLDTEKEY